MSRPFANWSLYNTRLLIDELGLDMQPDSTSICPPHNTTLTHDAFLDNDILQLHDEALL